MNKPDRNGHIWQKASRMLAIYTCSNCGVWSDKIEATKKCKEKK